MRNELNSVDLSAEAKLAAEKKLRNREIKFGICSDSGASHERHGKIIRICRAIVICV